MHVYRRVLLTAIVGSLLASAAGAAEPGPTPGRGIAPVLPPPDTSHKVGNYSRVIGWPDGLTPKAPAGFAVTRFAAASTARAPF